MFTETHIFANITEKMRLKRCCFVYQILQKVTYFTSLNIVLNINLNFFKRNIRGLIISVKFYDLDQHI